MVLWQIPPNNEKVINQTDIELDITVKRFIKGQSYEQKIDHPKVTNKENHIKSIAIVSILKRGNQHLDYLFPNEELYI